MHKSRLGFVALAASFATLMAALPTEVLAQRGGFEVRTSIGGGRSSGSSGAPGTRRDGGGNGERARADAQGSRPSPTPPAAPPASAPPPPAPVPASPPAPAPAPSEAPPPDAAAQVQLSPSGRRMMERVRELKEVSGWISTALPGAVFLEVLNGRPPEGLFTIVTAEWDAIATGMQNIDRVARQRAANEIRLLLFEYERLDLDIQPGPGEISYGRTSCARWRNRPAFQREAVTKLGAACGTQRAAGCAEFCSLHESMQVKHRAFPERGCWGEGLRARVVREPETRVPFLAGS